MIKEIDNINQPNVCLDCGRKMKSPKWTCKQYKS